MGCKKTFAILLASLLPAALVFVAPDAQRFVPDNVSGVTVKAWTTQDLVQMGKSKTMAVAVSIVTGDTQQPGAKALKIDGIKELIDNTSTAEIRSAMLMATTTGLLKTRRVKAMDKKIADFAATVNPAATCSAADTAGGNGRDACVLDCQHNRIFPAWPRRKGACYALCTLATAPCTADMLPKSWVTIKMERGWTAIGKSCAMISLKTVVEFLVLVMVALHIFIKIESQAIRDRTAEVKKKLEEERRALTKLKASYIVEVHSNLIKRRCFEKWHDNAAWATYRKSQEKAALLAQEEIVSRQQNSERTARMKAWMKAAAARGIITGE